MKYCVASPVLLRNIEEASTDESNLVMPVQSVKVHGPFDDFDEADAWASGNLKEPSWIFELTD